MKNTGFQFIPTRAAAAAQQAIDQVVSAGGVALMKGEAGSGKTALLRAYASANSQVLLYRAEVINTPRSLIQALLLQLGLVWTGGTRVGFMALRHLAAEAGCRAVLVDDSDRLTRTTFDMLRALHEGTGMTVVLAGSGRIGRLLVGKREELAHCVTIVHEVASLAFDDVLAFVRTDGRSRKRRSYWECVAVARALLRTSAGNFRRVVQLMEAARSMARLRHRRLSPSFIARASAGLPEVA